MPFPNPDTQFKPGQSGNPDGHSRGRRTTSEMLKLIESTPGAEKAIAQMWLKAVLSGDFRFFKEYMDRTEGKQGIDEPTTTDPAVSQLGAAEARADEYQSAEPPAPDEDRPAPGSHGEVP